MGYLLFHVRRIQLTAETTVPMTDDLYERLERCMTTTTYLFVHRSESAPWLILSSASSKSIRNHGYSPTMAQRHLATREMDKIVHLLRKVRRRRCRTWPLMNTSTYCRKFELAGGKCWKEENE